MSEVLIVDDSKLMRITIEKYLKKMGHNVIATASDGLEAMEYFEKFHPKIVTLDLTLPEKDGFECLEEMIKKDENVQVIVISAIKDVKTRMHLLNSGATEYLVKPLNEETFVSAVNRVKQ